MRVIVEGKEGNKKKRYTYNLYDRYHQPTKTSSMARTTGYTATAAAHLVLNGNYNTKGIIAPEALGINEKCYRFMFEYLKERGVNYSVVEE